MKSAVKDDIKIEIDRDLCIGAASCTIIAPNTFTLDDQGKVDILEGELDDKDTIIAAADSCPVRAITIIEQALSGSSSEESQIKNDPDQQNAISPPVEDSGDEVQAESQNNIDSSDEIVAVLKNVLDPELGINIVDLGLVYGVRRQGSACSVDLTLTTPGCPMITEFINNAKQAVLHAPGITEAQINLTFDPLWNPSKMSQAAKDELGLFL